MPDPGYYDMANMSMPTTDDVMMGVRANRRANGQPQRGKGGMPRRGMMPMSPAGGKQDPRAAMVREMMGQGMSYRDAIAKVMSGG